MHRTLIQATFLAATMFANHAGAVDADLEEGQRLFVKECKICHGDGTAPSHGAAPAVRPQHLAWLGPQVPPGFGSGTTPFSVAAGLPVAQADHSGADALAFAPPFGPNLQGVYGRQAGTAPGFQYSTAFLSALKEVVWDEATLNVWVTSPQAWVPGVYMFYRQKDPEIRRKIIAYLKSNASH